MTVDVLQNEQLTGRVYTGLSTDSKPTPGSTFWGNRIVSTFYETDTDDTYEYRGNSWVLTRIKGMHLTSDFYTEVAKGNISGHSIVHKYGRAPTSTINIERSVSDLGTMQFPTSASTMRVKAGGNAADTAAGAGAREITIYGLDQNGNTVEEAVATAGASASSATTTTFIRVFRARVTGAGTYATTSIATVGSNQADVVIEDSGGTADYITIPQYEGTSEYAGYHVNNGQTAYLLSFNADVDASKNADIVIYQRKDILTTSAPVSSRRVVHYFDGVSGNVQRLFKYPVTFPALTDIWVNFIPTANSTECSADMEILLVDN